MVEAMSTEVFEARLRSILAERYHDKHPFNLRMMAGQLTRAELQRWVRNRYYYQTRIPIKDGLILTKADDPGFRRSWIRRIHDHDGTRAGEGGLELWLLLAESVGCEREEVASLRNVLPGVRRACDAYVELVASHDLLTSVASSLTELSAGPYLGRRAEAFQKHYGWIADEGLAYFRSRTEQAPRDAKEGLAYVMAQARTQKDQDRCAEALEGKCRILWTLLDGVAWGGRRPQLAAACRLREDAESPGVLVVMPERAVRLSESGREILDACDGKGSVEALAGQLYERHPGVERLHQDVYDFVEKMEKIGVLELHP